MYQVHDSKLSHLSQGGEKGPSAQQHNHPLTSLVPSLIQHKNDVLPARGKK